MGGGPRTLAGAATRRVELVAEVEGHLRALLRDVLCGYLDSELKGVADDILLETNSEPFMEIEARDLRARAGAASPWRSRSRSGAEPSEPEPRPRPGHGRAGGGDPGAGAGRSRAELEPESPSRRREPVAVERRPRARLPSSGSSTGSPSRPTGASTTPRTSPRPSSLGAEQVLVHPAQAVQVVHVVLEVGHLDQRGSAEAAAQQRPGWPGRARPGGVMPRSCPAPSRPARRPAGRSARLGARRPPAVRARGSRSRRRTAARRPSGGGGSRCASSIASRRGEVTSTNGVVRWPSSSFTRPARSRKPSVMSPKLRKNSRQVAQQVDAGGPLHHREQPGRCRGPAPSGRARPARSAAAASASR